MSPRCEGGRLRVTALLPKSGACHVSARQHASHRSPADPHWPPTSFSALAHNALPQLLLPILEHDLNQGEEEDEGQRQKGSAWQPAQPWHR
jgi:hypothetical protein